jgi:uncharacterized protein with von Willebrand factor type A (vWA) domain
LIFLANIKTVTTGERMAKMETDIGYIKDAVEELKQTLKCHMVEQQGRFDTFDQKFAAKWVEKAVYGAVGVILALVITAGMGLILQ